MSWFLSEYRRHPFWAAVLVLILVVGLAFDFTLIRGDATNNYPDSWRAEPKAAP